MGIQHGSSVADWVDVRLAFKSFQYKPRSALGKLRVKSKTLQFVYCALGFCISMQKSKTQASAGGGKGPLRNMMLVLLTTPAT